MLLTEHGQDPFDQLNDNYKQFAHNGSIDTAANDEEKEEALVQKHAELEVNLAARICRGKKFIKASSTFNMIDIFYKFIVYKLIPSTVLLDNQETVDLNDAAYTPELDLEQILANDEFVSSMYGDSDEERADLKLFDFSDIKLKHVYHVWKLMNRVYLENSTKNSC
jgi:hypothetical protein